MLDMSANLKLAPSQSDASAIDALFDLSFEIAKERDKTEREIKALLEAGEDQKALRLMRKHLGVESKLKRIK
jgi:hypothetical protein